MHFLECMVHMCMGIIISWGVGEAGSWWVETTLGDTAEKLIWQSVRACTRRYSHHNANMHQPKQTARWQAAAAIRSGVNKLTSDFGFGGLGALALGAVRRLPGFNQRRLHVLHA